jgi:hypothetical protein
MTFCELVARPSLSIWHSVYRFIEKHHWQRVPLCTTVLEQVKAFLGIMPLLSTPERMHDTVRIEGPKTAKVLAAIGLKPE